MENYLTIPKNRPRLNPLRSVAAVLLIMLFFVSLLPDPQPAPEGRSQAAGALPVDPGADG